MSKVVTSGKAVLLGSFISKGISLISSIVLARLLFEKDYGAMLLSSIFAGLITQIGGMGYELYFLQHKGADEERRKVLQQVYNLRLCTNFFMFIIQASIGFYLFIYTDNRTSGSILMLISISLILEGFNSPQETLLKDKMEFRKITIGNILKELFATIGKVSAAFLGFGGLSFGFGPILGSLARLLYLLKVQPYKHDYFIWDKVKIKEIFHFGKHVLFGSAAMYLAQQIDRIFLSIFFPQNIVGRYGFAVGNASTISNYLLMPQGQLNLTYVTRYQAGESILFDKLKVIQTSTIILLLPVYVFGSIFLNEIIFYIFSDKWMSSKSIVEIFLVFYIVNLLYGTYMNVLTGLGKPKVNNFIVIIKAIVLVPTLYFVANLTNSIQYYALAFVLISSAGDFFKLFLSLQAIGVSFKLYLKKIKLDFLFLALSILTIACSYDQTFKVRLLIFMFYFIMYFIICVSFKRKLNQEIDFITNVLKIKK
jgi:O-antigen/teichoic acid export membrane protein